MAGETESLYEFSSGSVFSIVGSSDKNLRHDGPGGAGENSPGSSDPGKPTNKTTCTPDGVREMNVARGCSLKYSRTPSGVHGILENQKPRVYRPWAICLHPIRGDNTCGLMLVFPMIGNFPRTYFLLQPAGRWWTLARSTERKPLNQGN